MICRAPNDTICLSRAFVSFGSLPPCFGRAGRYLV
nr:MAG TPA: FAM24 family [Caudoviricetes sp.]